MLVLDKMDRRTAERFTTFNASEALFVYVMFYVCLSFTQQVNTTTTTNNNNNNTSLCLLLFCS